MDNKREDLCILRADGSIVVQEAFVFACYFDTPHKYLARLMSEAIVKYVDLVSLKKISIYYDNEGEPQPLTSDSLAELFDLRFFGRYRTPNANIILSSDDEDVRSYYLWYNGKALDHPEFPGELGYFWLWMPRSDYLEKSKKILEFIQAFVTDTPFSFAYASLGIVERNKQAMQGLARRHPGLDIAQPLCVSADLNGKAAGCYWMNFFGEKLTNACGGFPALRDSLPGELIINPLADGKTRILLGDSPEIGDLNRKDTLPNHQVLARFLDQRKLLHVPERVVYFVDDQGLADKEAQSRWHRRFLEE